MATPERLELPTAGLEIQQKEYITFLYFTFSCGFRAYPSRHFTFTTPSFLVPVGHC